MSSSSALISNTLNICGSAVPLPLAIPHAIIAIPILAMIVLYQNMRIGLII